MGGGGRLLDGPGRPYVRYSVDRSGRIHLLATEQHPHDFANGIYHAAIDDATLQRSDGAVVDRNIFDDDAVRPEQLTTVLPSGGGRAWTVDLQVDGDGLPYAVFTLLVKGPSPLADPERPCAGHCYYLYARFDGAVWRVHLLADAGSALSRNEPYYTGLVALHPTTRVGCSSPPTSILRPALRSISARDGRRHHEIFEGVTADGGVSWNWRAITRNSTVDNIRPIVPTGMLTTPPCCGPAARTTAITTTTLTSSPSWRINIRT